MIDWASLLERSYAPYSGCREVCIVRTRENGYWLGARIENASFPDTISSIQAALFIALSEGETPVEVLVPPGFSSPQTSYWLAEFKLDLLHIEYLTDITLSAPTHWIDLPSPRQLLTELREKAIVPHSNFRVSSLLETNKGWIYGVNIEVSDWRLGLCGERNAIVKALSSGLKPLHLMHVSTAFGEFCSPCGACRQVMLEHLPEGQIGLHHPNQTYSELFIADLLPWSFRSSNLLK